MILSIRMILVCATVMALVPSMALAANELSRAHGGNGGSSFLAMPSGGKTIAWIQIRSGKYVDSIQIAYRHGDKIEWGPRHGGGGGSPTTIKFEKDERIIEVGGRSGNYVDALYIRTDKKTYGPYGGNGGRPFAIKGQIGGLWGRAGAYLDAIGVVNSVDTIAGQSLNKYAPGAGGGGGKADSMTSLSFPAANANANGLRNWLTGIALSLQQTIRTLAGSDQAFASYSADERAYCKGDLYCEIAYRDGAIAYATGGR